MRSNRLDQAGWHGSDALVVPDNIRLLPLPSKSPELNPVENVWQFMRDNWLSNRIFKSYDDILDECCFAWNRLADQPWRVMSIGMRKWARGSLSMQVGITRVEPVPIGPAGPETADLGMDGMGEIADGHGAAASDDPTEAFILRHLPAYRELRFVKQRQVLANQARPEDETVD